MSLTIPPRKYLPHLMQKREFCGGASGSFRPAEFGLGAGKDWGFKMEVKLCIQVDAVVEE